MPRLTSYLLRSPSSAGACFPPVYIVHVAPRPRPPRAAAPRRAPPRAPHQNTIPRRTFIPTDISTQSTRIPTPIYLHRSTAQTGSCDRIYRTGDTLQRWLLVSVVQCSNCSIMSRLLHYVLCITKQCVVGNISVPCLFFNSCIVYYIYVVVRV